MLFLLLPPWGRAGEWDPWAPVTDCGPLSLEEDVGRVEELQELLEKQNFELSQARERLVTLTAAVAELEEDLGTARRDLIKSEELSGKHQRDLREVSKGPPHPLLPGAGIWRLGGQLARRLGHGGRARRGQEDRTPGGVQCAELGGEGWVGPESGRAVWKTQPARCCW